MEKTRVTVDFADEPGVLDALRERATKEKRSLGRQLLYECLPALKPKAKAAAKKGGAK